MEGPNWYIIGVAMMITNGVAAVLLERFSTRFSGSIWVCGLDNCDCYVCKWNFCGVYCEIESGIGVQVDIIVGIVFIHSLVNLVFAIPLRFLLFALLSCAACASWSPQ